MNIGLVAAKMKDRDINHQLNQIEYYMDNNPNCDIFVFGESYLQGFEGLTWDYEKDLKIALDVNSTIITTLRNLAKKHSKALSFGFIERDEKLIFSTNLFIGSNGEIINKFRRVSPGWKESIATSDYIEGKYFEGFTYMNKVFTTAICGDLWDNQNIEMLKTIKADICLWPLYIDYSVDDWRSTECDAYTQQASQLCYPVCMVNSYIEDESRANGGCYVFFKGNVIKELPLGRYGILSFSI